MIKKKLISIISPCFNEEENLVGLYSRVVKVMTIFPEYDYEYIFIDNASTDMTVDILHGLVKKDKRVKFIVNTRNFGHIRSPYWGILQTKGEATIYLAADLQDPPELIYDFIMSWREGYKIVLAVKPTTSGNQLVHYLRKSYYRALDLISEVKITRNATGFGIYDKTVVDHIRKINDPYPFLRGLVCELGYKIKEIPFNQPIRNKGISKNNLFTLLDIAMLGFVSHSKMLLRLSSILGFIVSLLSIILGITYLILKINNWNIFPPGVAPLIITIFFMFGLLFGILGILGEYISVIYTHVNNRPIVVEKERVNFEV
jgi:glycosyltransferase involved in cell wall biosynthesis